MQAEESFCICSNCNKKIPEEKILIHEAYCLRNFVKCSKCNEMIDKNQREAHEEEFHKKVFCKNCDQCFEGPAALANHELICDQKPKICKFCQLQIKFKDFSEHIYRCSTRTSKCEFCNKFIMMRDFEEHLPQCYSKKILYQEEFPVLNANEETKNNKNENIKNPIEEEEKSLEHSQHKKKLSSPTIPNTNKSPSYKKKNSKEKAVNNDYNEYWDEQDLIKDDHINKNPAGLSQNPQILQEPNINLPDLNLGHTQSSQNDDPELQRVLYESLCSNKK